MKSNKQVKDYLKNLNTNRMLAKDERHLIGVWVPKSVFAKYKSIQKKTGRDLGKRIKLMVIDLIEMA